MLSLSEPLISDMLRRTLPSYQASSRQDCNLGFGWLFYGFTRAVRPRNVVVIGSKAGFSVICFALALKDNAGSHIVESGCYETRLASPELGKVHFIDPSRSEARSDKGHWHGIGFWDDEVAVAAHWASFGVQDFVFHHKCTSADFLHNNPDLASPIDILLIDGDHSFEGVTHDFEAFHARLSPDALILAHDVDPRIAEVGLEGAGYQAISRLDRSKFELMRLAVFPGLAIARKL